MAAIITHVCGLEKAMIATCLSILIVSLSFIQFWCCDYFFRRHFMFSSFSHVCTTFVPGCVFSVYLMMMCNIFSIYSISNWLLVLIFSYIKFMWSKMRALSSVMIAIWMPMKGLFVAIVAWLAPVTTCLYTEFSVSALYDLQ